LLFIELFLVANVIAASNHVGTHFLGFTSSLVKLLSSDLTDALRCLEILGVVQSLELVRAFLVETEAALATGAYIRCTCPTDSTGLLHSFALYVD